MLRSQLAATPRPSDLHLPHIAPTGPRALSAAACYALRRKAHNESMRKKRRYCPKKVCKLHL